MIIHYDNQAAALAHLISNGWHLIENGNWVSRDGTCVASVHPITGREEVQIAYREIA